MTSCDDLIKSYEVEVEIPDVSGFEHLQMLLRRSDIENCLDGFSAEQKKRLVEADKQFWQQRGQFYEALDRIADLAKLRADNEPPVTHWWWYLDVLAAIPASVVAESQAVEKA